MRIFPITSDGYKKIYKELVHLKTIKRPEVLKLIRDATEHGDLSENAEYDAAKLEHSILERKIYNIERKLSRSKIVIPYKGFSRIVFGSTVRLMDLKTKIIKLWTIVGDNESSVNNGKISINSPIARSLIGKRVKDVVDIKVPCGIRTYKVISFL